MADRKIVEALSSFTVINANGVPYGVRQGELYSSDDPVVAGSPALFGPPVVKDSTAATRRVPPQREAVETAVAPPAGPTRAPVTGTGRKLAAASKAQPAGEV